MRTLIIEADGASRGNPGEAVFGAAARVTVRMDSKLVVEQMSGRRQVKHPDLRPLAALAHEVSAILPGGAVAYEWFPRNRNKHADRLANEALDAAAQGPACVSNTPTAVRTAQTSETPRTPGVAAAAAPDAASPAAPAPAVRDASAALTASAKSQVAWSPDLGRPTRLLLLRHGVTPLTVEKRFAGIGDPPLTDQGREQARRAAERLRDDRRYGPVDVIAASPLRRALATAEAVSDAVGVPVLPEPAVREIDFGRLEGLTFAEAHERFPAELSAFLASPEVPPPGGEPLADVARRVAEARDRLIANHPRRTILVATHVTPIKILVCQALGAPLSAVNRMELAAASLSVIDYYDDGLCNVRCVNDTAHLD